MPDNTGEVPSEEAIESFKHDCPTVFEALERNIPWKLVIEVPLEHLNAAETVLSATHKRIYSESAPFISVDVAEILENSGVTAADFDRDMIYQAALEALSPDVGPEKSKYPLDDFEKASQPFEDAKTPVLLFLKNFDAVTSQLPKAYPQSEIGHLLLTTFRVGGEFKRCMHVCNCSSLGSDFGGGLNDAVIIRE